MGILWTLIIGAIAGWLGSQIFKGGSLGLIGNIGRWIYWVLVVGRKIGRWSSRRNLNRNNWCNSFACNN